MKLDDKTIETVAIAISIAAGCEPCTRYHLGKAAELGATRAEMIHAAGLPGAHGRSPAALAFDELAVMAADDGSGGSLERHAALARIGISACRNDVRLLRESIRFARERGVADEEIMEVVGLAGRIKEKAASHLDKLIERLDADPDIRRAAASLCT